MHRSKKPSSQRIWSAWGDWIWSTSQNRYYSQRQDTYGEIETRWGPVYDDVQVPRQRADREDLVGAFQGVHLGDGEEEYQDDPSYPHSQPAHAGQAAGYSKSSGKRDDRKKKDRKGKGKSYFDEEDEDYDVVYDDPDDGAGTAAQGQGSRHPAQDDRYTHRGKSTRQYSPPSAQSSYVKPGRAYAIDDLIDDDPYATPAASSRTAYNPGGASSSHVDPEYEEAESESGIASSANDYISGIENELDLDPRYRIEPSYKFQPGEVFKVLWPEPAGGTSGKAPSLSDKKEVRDNYGGSIFVGFRRFIVVANDAGHCTCVPISTYGAKGCKKRGIKPEKHGIITEKGVRSKRLDGEPKLGFPTVRMKILVDGERLARESRVNYSKIVTVEHNVKVFFIGTIYGDDYDLVVDAVNKCWEMKTFFKKH